ncbi:MAG: RNA 2',3'-cyclic phosphodiesterase [Gammaproteobacteria bacterium]|nr:RNA 2',3'-cyclic phosphodiesterase [Gammaproteobacteria bacterium]
MADTESGSGAPARPVRRRVFFALWPDDTTRTAIACATRDAVRHCGGKPTPVENLHVTLAFLGPITPVDLAKVEALTPPASAPFELVLDRIYLWQRAQIFWIGPNTIPEPLLTLEHALWDSLVDLGFRRERRPYVPHVTLARKAQIARGTVSPVPWRVEGISLVESKTGPRSSRYTVLKSWPFD